MLFGLHPGLNRKYGFRCFSYTLYETREFFASIGINGYIDLLSRLYFKYACFLDICFYKNFDIFIFL